jgi:hypothetical protein
MLLFFLGSARFPSPRASPAANATAAHNHHTTRVHMSAPLCPAAHSSRLWRPALQVPLAGDHAPRAPGILSPVRCAPQAPSPLFLHLSMCRASPTSFPPFSLVSTGQPPSAPRRFFLPAFFSYAFIALQRASPPPLTPSSPFVHSSTLETAAIQRFWSRHRCVPCRLVSASTFALLVN